MLYRGTAWKITLVLWCALVAPVCLSALEGQRSAPAPGDEASSIPAESQSVSRVRVPPTTSLGVILRYQGNLVREIEFRGANTDSKILSHVRELLVQRTGEPLDRLKIRNSIQALYKTGYFSSIRVEVERVGPTDVRVVFVVRNNLFLGGVTVTGNPKRPHATQLVNASKLQLGELYTREKLQRAIDNIQSVLAANGYYQAVVEYERRVEPKTQQVNIQFRITPNRAARVGDITIKGTPGYSQTEIEKIGHIHNGDAASAQRVTNALQNLRKRYQKAGRLEAQVSVVDRKYHPETNRLDYVFDIDRGPTVDVVVEGPKLSKGILKKHVPIYEENAVDDDLLNEGRRNLRDFLQTQGFFDAEVNFTKEYDAPKDQLHVIYTVNRGTRHKLAGIEIAGNKYFSEEIIRERLGIRVATGLLSNGTFSQSQVNRDVESIENLYRSNGFLNVKINATVVPDFAGNKDDLGVRFQIDEGTQTRVSNLQILGNKSISEESIRNLIQTSAGQPYSEENIATDRDAVVNYYFNHGFPNIQFESASKPAIGRPGWMDVVFSIKEGDQVFVNKVLVSGTHYTRPYVIQRDMKVHSADPLSQLAMLDTQRRLYDLGIFNEVDMAVQNPEGDAKYKDILFDVREAKRWTFNYGFGFEIQTGGQPLDADQINTAPAPGVNVPPNTTPPQSGAVTANPQGGTGISPRISFDVTRLNFRGRDHTLLFKSHFSQLSRRALMSYDAPRWLDKENLRLTFTAFGDNSRDVRTFSSERIEGSVQAEDVLSNVSTILFRFSYRRVKVDPRTLVISPELVPLLSKPVRVGLPSFTYIRDKRDDPIDTHKGNYTTFDTGVAAGAFGSAANFGRLLLQNSTYAPIKKRFVLARSTRIGVAEPFGTGDNAIVPLPERFYAGGSQLLRGFALNQAGPRDLFTGFPIGGNAVFVNQVELRLPPFELPFVEQNLNFVLFHDSGNVFASGQDMVSSLLRWYQPRREACAKAPALDSENHLIPQQYGCDFNYMSNAAGIGARYKTPVGPIRMDFSYNFNPPSFPFYVQCPATPPSSGACASLPGNSLLFQTGTLRHFNFSFSIGQTF